ncbi:MAG TPA: hypothetical protein VFT74_18380 [Isosphaeraceae bacterium]|nr:hypothetical protein [Isosphaeraceae bacterium]
MPSTLESRFRENLERVHNLIELYERLCPDSKTPDIQETDLLRASVVLLHACVEDLLRTIAADRLIHRPQVLSTIPFPGDDMYRVKFTLADLARTYGGRRVDEVLKDAVLAYLGRRAYNNTDDIASALGEAGLPPSLVAAHASDLNILMKRRHHVVHRLDRDEEPGSAVAVLGAINVVRVRRWFEHVEAFGLSVVQHLETLAGPSEESEA